MFVSAIVSVALGSMLQSPAKIIKPPSYWQSEEYQKLRAENRKLTNPGKDYKPLLMPKLETELTILRVYRDSLKHGGIPLKEMPIEFKYRSKLSPVDLASVVEKPLKDQGWTKMRTDDSGFRFKKDIKDGPVIWQEITISLEMIYYYRTGLPAPTQLIYIEKIRI